MAKIIGGLIGAQVAEGKPVVQNTLSIVQLWNPPDSEVDFHIKLVHCGWNATLARDAEIEKVNGFDFCVCDTAITDSEAERRYLMPTVLDMTSSSDIELRVINAAPPYPGTRLAWEEWPGGRGDSGPVPFGDEPLICRPGIGVLFRPAHKYTWNIISVLGRAVEAE